MFFFANYILLQCDIQPFAEYAVAPHVGAWIETDDTPYPLLQDVSHPMWVRGLKHQRDTVIVQVIESHPMWVRGLKPHIFEGAMPPVSRTPCGCVD